MEGLNWAGIVFYVIPIFLTALVGILIIIAEIVVQVIVTANKIRRRKFWEKK